TFRRRRGRHDGSYATVSPVPPASPLATVRPRSLQTHQIGSKRVELAVGEGHARHQGARLVALRIGEPRAHARDVAREDTGADRRAAADACEVRTGGAMRRRPPGHVAAYARPREANAVAVPARGGNRRGPRGEPCGEV